MSEPGHPIEKIQEALDGRLDAEGRRWVEAHLRSCASCHAEAERISWTKQFVRGETAPPEVPSALRSAITAALDREDRAAVRPRPAQPWWLGWRLRWGLVAAVAGVLAFLLLWPSEVPLADPVVALARDYDWYAVADPPLDQRTTDAGELERFFLTRDLGLTVRVFDLGMMGYQIVGGSAHAVVGLPGALTLYQGPVGRLLLCQMFRGQVQDLGGQPEVREHGGIRFEVRRLGDRTLVSWQEGVLVCVLTSDGPSEEVINLAFAKALKA